MIDRRKFISAVSFTSLIGVTSCAGEDIARQNPEREVSVEVESAIPEGGTNPRKWVHIGDSLTASGFLGEMLSGLTGYEHMNAGLSGDTSSKAAMRLGAKKFSVVLEDKESLDGEPILVKEIIPTSPFLPNGWPYPVEVGGVFGYMVTEPGSFDTYFHPSSKIRELRGGVEEVVIDPNGDTDWLRKGFAENYSMIICLGRNDIVNNFVSADEVVDNILSIYNMQSGDQARRLVWEIPKWKSDVLYASNYEKVKTINGMLSDELGEDFVRPVSWIVENPEDAFKYARVPYTEQDQMDIEEGIIPTSFRNDDEGHFNEVGARAWGHYMYQELKKRGW